MSIPSQTKHLEANPAVSRAGLLQSTSQLLSRSCQRLKSILRPSEAEASARRFMEFCRRKWPWNPSVKHDSVVLIGLFPHKIATYCNLHLANDLARRTGAGIEAFSITNRPNPLVAQVYASGGARLGLDASFAEEARPELEKRAGEIFAGLRSKEDLVELRYDGLKIGDLIYDSFLRYHVEPTVNLGDPRLREIMVNTLVVYVATANYLKVRKVIGFIAHDYSYHETGVVTRLLLRAGVPIYFVNFGTRYFLYQVFGEPEFGNFAPPVDRPVEWPYHYYRSIFQSMPEAEQAACREKGLRHLDGKLAGQLDPFTLVDVTAYGESGEKIFADTGRPRVLVLLHDFFDSPHAHRWMLFPDFYEWVSFLCERASETPFDWYVKPHPSSWDPARKMLNESNETTIKHFRERFPKIHFLPPTVSNRQIVAEGINAMFTLRGTGGHEFSRMGIPVVNAGDNPHIAYDFNYHPRTTEEYAELIAQADRLHAPVMTDDIAEYVYMNYFYFDDHCGTGATPLAEEFFADPNIEARCASPNGYDLIIAADDPKCEAGMKKLYDDYFDKEQRARAQVWETVVAQAQCGSKAGHKALPI